MKGPQPGSPGPMALPGQQTGSYGRQRDAFGPTIGTSLNTTLLSYAGTCDIGINIDTAAIPDPHVLLACLQESAAEITTIGAVRPARRPARDLRTGHGRLSAL
jgi:diacylglycerol O-acyltransferase / wax synthase